MRSARFTSLRHVSAYSCRQNCMMIWLSLLLLLGAARSYDVPSYVIDHAPLIWLHSDEPYMPSDILTHIHHTTPFLDFTPLPNAPSLSLDNLSTLNTHGPNIYLTSIENVTAYPPWFYGTPPDPVTYSLPANTTACAVILVPHKPPSDTLDAFYFYFYSFNEGGDITQVLPPLERIFPNAQVGLHFGDHVGDWEHNMIRFRAGQPVGVYFSAHSGGSSCLWEEEETCLEKKKDGKRPVVFSARGSHANYPRKGKHVHDEALVDLADEGVMWDPVRSAYFYHYDVRTDTFSPAGAGAGEGGRDSPLVDWLEFAGRWGDKMYSVGDPRQQVVPWFGLKKYEDGPTGPRFKHLVRRGLCPDVGHRTTLLGLAVRWYLRLYGCCLKGWDAWVVVVGFVVVLVILLGLTVFSLRRLRPVSRLKAAVGKLRVRKHGKVKEDEDIEMHHGLLDSAGRRASDELELDDRQTVSR